MADQKNHPKHPRSPRSKAETTVKVLMLKSQMQLMLVWIIGGAFLTLV